MDKICPECLCNEKLEGYPDPNCKTCHGTGIVSILLFNIQYDNNVDGSKDKDG